MLQEWSNCRPNGSFGNGFVPNAGDLDPESIERNSPFSIGFFGTFAVVHIAIDLYHKPMFRAVEVDDESADDLLASKLQPVEPSSFQERPSACFSEGRGLSHSLRCLELRRINALSAKYGVVYPAMLHTWSGVGIPR